MSASPDRPAQPMAEITSGTGQQPCEQTLDLVAGQGVLPARERSAPRCAGGSGARSSTPSYAPTWSSSRTAKARRVGQPPRVSGHPTGRPRPPAGRPTCQPSQPPPRRPHRWGRPHPPTSRAGGDCRCRLTPPAATSRTASRASACLPVTAAGRWQPSVGRWPAGGVTVQPIGLAIGPRSGLLSQLGPGHHPEGAGEASPGHGPLRRDLGLFVGAPGAVFASRGMGLWCGCTVDGTCRIVHADHVRQPCGS
jgi:hypothetical protein